jgi:hypothetical protein
MRSAYQATGPVQGDPGDRVKVVRSTWTGRGTTHSPKVAGSNPTPDLSQRQATIKEL